MCWSTPVRPWHWRSPTTRCTARPGLGSPAAAAALGLQENNFPESRFLPGTETPDLLREFTAAGLAGGAIYDGLVGAAAREHGLLLITCGRRAEPTNRALGVRYELLSPVSG